MIKNLVLTFILVLAYNSILAQTVYLSSDVIWGSSNFKFIPKTKSYFEYKPIYNPGFRLNLNYSPLSAKMLLFSIGFSSQRLGAKMINVNVTTIDDPEGDDNGKLYVYLDYVNLSIGAGIDLKKYIPIKILFEPYLGYKIRENHYSVSKFTNNEKEEIEYISNVFGLYDYGLKINLIYSFYQGNKWSAFSSFSALRGIKNIYNEPYFQLGDYFNRAFSIGLGVSYHLKE